MSSRRSNKPAPIWKPGVFNWIRYSGASISITVNPLHWRLIPDFQEPLDTWIGPNEKRLYLSWLMLTVRIWIDDGAW